MKKQEVKFKSKCVNEKARERERRKTAIERNDRTRKKEIKKLIKRGKKQNKLE